MRVRQHCALLLLLHAWLRALDRHGVLCGIVAVRRDGGALALPDGEADWRRAGRDAGGAVVPAQPEQDPPRHQGGQPAPHRGWHGQARRLRRLGAAQHVHLAARDGDRHALLDGARGDPAAKLRLQGRHLVPRHHRARDVPGRAAARGRPPDEGPPPHPRHGAAPAAGREVVRRVSRLCRLLPQAERARAAHRAGAAAAPLGEAAERQAHRPHQAVREGDRLQAAPADRREEGEAHARPGSFALQARLRHARAAPPSRRRLGLRRRLERMERAASFLRHLLLGPLPLPPLLQLLDHVAQRLPQRERAEAVGRHAEKQTLGRATLSGR
mmetsp:Transcript_43366/g.139794  ORF Transcript_43366/g.139794 Transcript_43366/m.139794 type:complete len:327 (-) Transcript_43366:724-1704(-)